jgi:threonine/homoserine/homoserine lactone efflux protein
MHSLLPFALFAFVASITPGPTNILVMTSSARHGVRAVVPVVVGACSSAAVIVVVVGWGLGGWFVRYPVLQTAMAWAGIAWLSLLSWQIFRSTVADIDPARVPVTGKTIGLVGAAGLQIVNPKVWMMALAVVGVFAGNGADQYRHVLLLALVFFLIALPCMSVWAVLGDGIAHLCRSPRRMRWFNRTMALLLQFSAWSTLLV